MKILKRGLLIKFLKIFALIIFIFPNSIAFGAISYVDDINVPANGSNGQNTPHGVTFNSDGTKMYVIGSSANRVIQYTLSTPFDISEATLLAGSICTEGFAGDSDGLKVIFNSDGTKFFLVDDITQDVDILTLTTAYDISTCNNTGSKDFGTTNLRDLKFSNDGKKVFLYDQAGNNHKIKQYTLSSAFDISNPTLVTTYTGTDSQTLKVQVGNKNKTNGLAFSSDGSKMFVTSDTKITEFTLSNPFDLSNVTYEGRENISAQVAKISGIAFNNDGSKMFIVDWGTSTSDIHEYNLTCGFGVKKCIDPTSNKDDVASIESQSETTKKIIQHTTYPVINRMEWLRRNSGRVNLTNQNIKFQFSNEMLNALSSSLIPLYFTNDNSTESNYTNSNWSFWSEGNISIGRKGDSTTSSFKDIKTSAITLGADKKGKDDIMRGIALRFGADDVDVGDLGSALDMSSFSLTFYQSKPKGEQRFTDNLIGMSFINSDLINNSGSTSTDGERYGEQLYGSLSLRDTFSKNRLNFTPKLKINYGITHLAAYTETGATGLNLKYNDQYIGNFTSSVGTSLDNTYDFKMGSFIPYFDFEYYADMSPSSEQKFSYVSNGESFIIENINNSTHNIIGAIGFDFISENGLTLMTKYTRDQSQSNKNDSFIIALDYRGSQRSSYAMSVQDTSAKLSHNKELNDFKINIDSHYDFFKDDPDYGVYLKISNVN
jgi:uncharacterized protein YhjY with autotransporter beta-barrel domain